MAQDTTLEFEDWLRIASGAGLGHANAYNLDQFYNTTLNRLSILETNGTGGSGPYVDLRLAPYNVVADSTVQAVRFQNTEGIMQAIQDYTGTHATLVLPPGTTYVEEDQRPAAPLRRHCIRFFTGDSDLTLSGTGMFGSKLSMYATSDGGDLHLLVIDGASRIQICNLSLELDTIENIEVTQQNHVLCLFNNQLGGTTEDIRINNVYFGKANGDQVRVLADASSDKVRNVEVSHCIFRGFGTVTSVPPNSRTGARCAIAIQRGGEDITFIDCYLEGAQNSLLDEEPSAGAARRVRYIRCHFNNARGNTDNVCSLGGSGGGDLAYDGLMEDCYISGGCISMLGGTSGFTMRRCVIEQTGPSPFDPTTPLFYCRSGAAGHVDLTIEGCTFKRTGTSGAGLMLDIVNSSNRTVIKNNHFIQTAAANIASIEAAGIVDIDGNTIQYDGSGATSRVAITVSPIATGGTISHLMVNNLRLTSSTGKFAQLVAAASRASRLVTRASFKDLWANGSASIGVALNCTAATFDTNFEITGIDVGTDLAYETRNDSNSLVTTYAPVIGGNRSGIATFEGTGAPTFSAPLGSLYLRKDGGALTTLYVNTSGSTTWTAK